MLNAEMRVAFRRSRPFFLKTLQQMITFIAVSVTRDSFTSLKTGTSKGIWSIFSVHLNVINSENDSAATENFNLFQSLLDAFGNDRVA